MPVFREAKPLIDKVYNSSPPFIQNLLLSAYGIYLNRLQCGGDYGRCLAQIENNHKLSRDELNAQQVRKVSAVVENAILHVPYYKKLASSRDPGYFAVNEPGDIKKLPLLDKAQVKRTPTDFIDERFRPWRLLSIETTGTTGSPLKVYFRPVARQQNFAFYHRFLKHGFGSFARKATFGGRLVVSSNQRKPPFWRYNAAQKNLLMSSYHLTDDFIPYYVAKLSQFQPDYIDTYPSCVLRIAQYMEKHNIDGKGMTRAIVTSSECLLAHQREIVESVFKAPVFDQYGSVEMSVFVGQCKQGRYHIHTDYGLLEFLRPDGTDAEPGEEAELVCTGLINPIMPLIRYRIGDRGVLSNEVCTCGSSFPVMEKLLGRKDDVIITPDGRRVSRLGMALHGHPIQQAQFIQREDGKLTVRVVKDADYTTASEIRLEKNLRGRLGDQLELEFEYVDTISRGPGGKMKTIVSNFTS